MLILVGFPIFYLEVSFGQFSSLGIIQVWKASPIAKGLHFPYVYPFAGNKVVVCILCNCGIHSILPIIGFCSRFPFITHYHVPQCISYKLLYSFTGIGFAMTSITFILSMYYNIIVAYAIYYFFSSMTDVLPWTTCGLVKSSFTESTESIQFVAYCYSWK